MAQSTTTSTQAGTSANRRQEGWSTRRIAVTALFCAVSVICTLFLEFPIIPGVTFLKYDPSGIVALIAGFAFGPATGAIVSILPYLVHLATESGLYGTIMAILATLTLVLPAAAIYQRNKTSRGMAVGLVVGGIVCLAACILGNLLITPLYMGVDASVVVGMIVPALLPFNVAKIVLNCVIAALAYKPVSKALAA
jgi:riboflavin transporter FmnP